MTINRTIKVFILKLYISLLTLLGVRKMHFIHIGKTGGSAVRNAFASKSIISGKIYYSGKWLFIMHGHRFTLFDCPKKDKVFFIVRDPIERYVSGFNSRLRQGRPKNDNPWNSDEKKAFEYFKTPNDLAESLFNEGLVAQKAATAMRTIGHVSTSYWDWFGDSEYIIKNKDKINAVLRTKYLNEDFKIFSNINCPNVKLPNKKDLKSHSTPSGFSSRLSPLAIQNLRRWYDNEYKFLDLLEELNIV